ncbi:Acyl-CoA dehydrogenase NM domain-like protein [Mycena kentingensis (nom. inval.)]|nr:Acyl-CoA dehydrogenase NM domain-like protein [Mycena kentingensis (nom. inval.)]
MRVEDIFHQTPPQTGNPYLSDPALPSRIKRLAAPEALKTIEPDLIRFGDVVVDVLRPLAPLVREPVLTQYDHWGRRIDDIQVSEAWKTLKDLVAKEGLVSIAFERQFQEKSRVWSFAKALLLIADSFTVMCPYAMTDGAARVLELSGTPEMKAQVLPRLLSTDPAKVYTSGQWMTESPGGSDVSRIETVARPTEQQVGDLGPAYLLDGFKWFSSAAEGNMAVALARSESSHGTAGLSLFLVPVRLTPYPTPLSNNILLHRLKNKIGTKTVPTAELALNGARAWRIGAPGDGIRAVSAVLNITRVHSSVSSVGALMRCLSLARAYADVREVDGGKLLRTIPAHMERLARVSVLYRALVHFLFGVVTLLGQAECGIGGEEVEARLRMLTPTLKAFASLHAVTAMEECMEALGGQGYMEETGIGRLIKDALVEKIWEGTVEVLAHDLIRASRRQGVASFVDWGQSIISSALKQTPSIAFLQQTLAALPDIFLKTRNPLLPRAILTLFGHVASALYLLEHAVWARKSDPPEPTYVAEMAIFERWVEEGGMKVALRELELLNKQGADKVEQRVQDNLLLVGTKL